jgi:hypothetical protein
VPNGGESYYIRYTGSFTTDNGVTKDLDRGWLETSFI